MYGSKYAVTDAKGVKRLAQLVAEKNESKKECESECHDGEKIDS